MHQMFFSRIVQSCVYHVDWANTHMQCHASRDSLLLGHCRLNECCQWFGIIRVGHLLDNLSFIVKLEKTMTCINGHFPLAVLDAKNRAENT